MDEVIRKLIYKLTVIANERQEYLDKLWQLENEAKDLRIKLNERVVEVTKTKK